MPVSKRDFNRDQIMTYQEVAEYLGKPVITIKHAIDRKVLTPLPRTELKRYLLVEQVKLFKDRPISLSSLTQEEYKIWEKTALICNGELPPEHQRITPIKNINGMDIAKKWVVNAKTGLFDSTTGYDPHLKEVMLAPFALCS